MKRIYLSALVTLAFGGWLHAGEGTVGNGGAVVVCFDAKDKAKSAELFDYFEAAETILLKPDLGDAGNTYLEIVETLIQRVAKNDIVRSERLREHLKLFKTSSRFTYRAVIKEIDDSRELVLPKDGCYKLQAVVQVRNPRAREAKFLIDKEIWELLNPVNKAGLVFHELLYLDEIERGASTSDGVRMMNAVWASSAGKNMPIDEFTQLVRQNSQDIRSSVRIDGQEYQLHPGVEFHPNGKVKKAVPYAASVTYPLPAAQAQVDCSGWFRDSRGYEIKNSVELHEDGSLASCSPTETDLTLTIQGVKFPIPYASRHHFYPSGMIRDEIKYEAGKYYVGIEVLKYGKSTPFKTSDGKVLRIDGAYGSDHRFLFNERGELRFYAASDRTLWGNTRWKNFRADDDSE